MNYHIAQDIPGYEGLYQATRCGQILSLGRTCTIERKGRVYTVVCSPCTLRAKNVKRGKRLHRLEVALYNRDGVRKTWTVHALVMLTFGGPTPPGQMICHTDSNPRNNAIDNLRFDTAKGNAADRVGMGTDPRGERNGSAKLSAGKVESIRRLTSIPSAVLAQAFGVSVGTIRDIRCHRSWTHLQ